MQTHITFDGVKGYATYANAEKRGLEVAAKATKWQGNDKGYFRWMVVALPTGRFVPVFSCSNFPCGPMFFLSLTNVCTIN
jgi:hypothetical protein